MAKKGNYQIISVRLTQPEYEAAKDAASQESLSLNGFCRQAIIERYNQLLDDHGKDAPIILRVSGSYHD